MGQDIVTSLYGKMVRPVYDISGDPNNLTRQYAYIRRPQGNTTPTVLLHGILPRRKPRVFCIYAIVTFYNITIFTLIFYASQTRREKCHLIKMSTILAISIYAIFSLSNSIRLSLYFSIWLSFSDSTQLPLHVLYFWFESRNFITSQVSFPWSISYIIESWQELKSGIVEYFKFWKINLIWRGHSIKKK